MMKRFPLLLLASSLLLVSCNDDSGNSTSSGGNSTSTSDDGGSSNGGSSGSSNCSSCSYYRTQINNAASDLQTEQDRLARYKSNGTSSSTIKSQANLVQSKQSYLSNLKSKASSCGC